MNLSIFDIIALHPSTRIQQISQTLLSIAEYTLLFMTVVNTKLFLLVPVLRVVYPPLYKRHVWDYAKANAAGINKAISQLDWQEFLLNLIVNEQVIFFNSTLTNIFSNFIRKTIVTCNDQDLPWFGEKT